MQTTYRWLMFPVSLIICLFAAASAEQVESMKLLTSESGWAATDKKLFWTSDGGSHWKDITPRLKREEQNVSSIFFLDSSAGWVLLHCGDSLFRSHDPLVLKSDRDLRRDDACFEVASTLDSGRSWSIVHPAVADPVSNPEDGSGFSAGTFLDFADRQHGWAILKNGTHSGVSMGVMLRTTDGGRTWTQLKSHLPMAEHFHFVDPKMGWMAGGPEHDLYVTRDAGDSWQKVDSLPDMGDDLPVFQDEHRGLLPVGKALLATGDGGKTWKQTRPLTSLPDDATLDVVYPSVIAASRKSEHEPRSESQYIVVSRLSLYTFAEDGNVSVNTARVPVAGGGAIQLSFLDRHQGWANLSGSLFATRDAGRNWVDITPGGSLPPRVWIQ